MRQFRKALALLLCLAVCLTLVPAAFAEEPTGDALAWEEAPVANETKPVITGQPGSISVASGDTVTFTVKATGTNLKYQWQLLAANTTVWQNMTGKTSATLSFTASMNENSNAYRCVVSNSAGSATSELALLSVTQGSGTVTKPSITTQPKSVTAADGTTAKMTVVASGSSLSYQWQYRTSSSASWQKSGASGATTKTISIAVSTAKNGYQYRCIVSNSAGSVTSSAATLTVTKETKPTITKHPTNVSAPAGTQVTMSVTATGASLRYQWQYRTSSSAAWQKSGATGATTKTISISTSAAKNGYQYRCIVSNGGGSVTSNAATLTVTAAVAKPTITTNPKNVSAAAGTTATMNVRATGTGLSYQWQYRTSSSGTWQNSGATGAKTNTISINVTAAKNGYQFRCVVSNSSGTAYSTAATLTVVAKPTITTNPKNVTAAAGTTKTMTVAATGTGLSYQWQYRTSSSAAWQTSGAEGAKTKTISISVTAAKNGYQYRCAVSNAAGTVYSSAATLTVVTAPSITTNPKSVSAAAGTTTTMTVAAKGTGLSYQWQYRTSSSAAWQNSGTEGSKTKTITINVTASKNGYQYRCKVSNSAGTAYSSAATLTVVAMPKITVNPKDVTAVAGTTKTMTVTATGTGLSYQWQYRTSSSAAWQNSGAEGAKTNTIYISATLAKNGYQFRCVVSNSVGTAYSTAATLTVTPAVSAPTITYHPQSVSTTAGTTVTMYVGASGSNLSYQWQYRTSSSGTWQNSGADGAKTDTIYISATLGKNGYQFRCKVTNAGGTAYSNAATLTVKNNVTAPTITSHPQNVTTEPGTTVTMYVGASGSGLSYQWQYRTSSSGSWQNSGAEGAKTNTIYINATTGKNGYQYRCRVYNAGGEVYSSVATLTVTIGAPTLQLGSVGNNSVGLRWSSVSGASSYTVLMGTSSSSLYTYRSGLTGTSVTVTGLSSNTTYYFAVYAVVNGTSGARSNTVSAKTTVQRVYRALVVGQSDYTRQNDLPSCANDIVAMKNMLEGLDNSFRVTSLANATASQILNSISSTFAGATENDVSLFYYSGHGCSPENSEVAGALIGRDGVVYVYPDGSFHSIVDCVTMSQLASALSKVPGQKIVILDSCHSGAAIDSNGVGGFDEAAAFNQSVIDAFAAYDTEIAANDLSENSGELRQSKFVVITASRYSETSRENAFTPAFIEGCGCYYPSGNYNGNMLADSNGDNALTVSEIYNYTYTAALQRNSEQHARCYASNMSDTLFKR